MVQEREVGMGQGDVLSAKVVKNLWTIYLSLVPFLDLYGMKYWKSQMGLDVSSRVLFMDNIQIRKII
jgi:hypothetical protein